MATTKEILAASPIGEEIREFGLREGRREGLQKGQQIEARKTLAILIDSRFPELSKSLAIGSVDDLTLAENLFRALLAARTSAQARTAINRILKRKA